MVKTKPKTRTRGEAQDKEKSEMRLKGRGGGGEIALLARQIRLLPSRGVSASFHGALMLSSLTSHTFIVLF